MITAVAIIFATAVYFKKRIALTVNHGIVIKDSSVNEESLCLPSHKPETPHSLEHATTSSSGIGDEIDGAISEENQQFSITNEVLPSGQLLVDQMQDNMRDRSIALLTADSSHEVGRYQTPILETNEFSDSDSVTEGPSTSQVTAHSDIDKPKELDPSK